MALLRWRISSVTPAAGTPNISIAVRTWTSSPVPKRFDEHGVLRQVREHAELDLRVVRAHEHAPGGATNARRISFPSAGTHGDVLEVGVLGRDASRRGNGLAPAGVDAARRRVDELRQRVDIGSLELRDGAVLETQSSGARDRRRAPRAPRRPLSVRSWSSWSA